MSYKELHSITGGPEMDSKSVCDDLEYSCLHALLSLHLGVAHKEQSLLHVEGVASLETPRAKKSQKSSI
jgi:hypothetical protein